MILFSLPGFHEFFKLNHWFIHLKKEKHQYFYPDVVIDNIYGSFPNIPWNGGRNGPVYQLDLLQVEKIFDDYRNLGVCLRFTFTNGLLDNTHLNDSYANRILELINKYGFEITVTSNVLENYIRKKYPHIPLISSTTKCILDIDELNAEMERDYKLVVLDFRKNADMLFLQQIAHKDRIELLLNEDCFCTCEQRMRHYRDISMNILMEDKMPDTEVYCCGKYENLYASFAQKTTIRVEDIYGKYKDMGFYHVKLRGRRSEFFDVMESYLYYMIRSEYRDQVRLQALQADLRENY